MKASTSPKGHRLPLPGCKSKSFVRTAQSLDKEDVQTSRRGGCRSSGRTACWRTCTRADYGGGTRLRTAATTACSTRAGTATCCSPRAVATCPEASNPHSNSYWAIAPVSSSRRAAAPSPVTAGRPMAPRTAPDPPATLPLGDDLPELPSVPAAEFPPGPSAVPTGIMLTQGLISSVSIGPLLERRPRRPSFAADTQALLSPAGAKPPALPSPAALPRRAEGPPARSLPPVKVPAALPPPATKRRRSPFPPALASPCKTGREPTGQS